MASKRHTHMMSRDPQIKSAPRSIPTPPPPSQNIPRKHPSAMDSSGPLLIAGLLTDHPSNQKRLPASSLSSPKLILCEPSKIEVCVCVPKKNARAPNPNPNPTPPRDGAYNRSSWTASGKWPCELPSPNEPYRCNFRRRLSGQYQKNCH